MTMSQPIPTRQFGGAGFPIPPRSATRALRTESCQPGSEFVSFCPERGREGGREGGRGGQGDNKIHLDKIGSRVLKFVETLPGSNPKP